MGRREFTDLIDIDLTDKDAVLEAIMEDFGESVVWLAYSYLKDKGKAEDIAQEVFIICYTKLDSFNNNASLKSWVLTITANKCKDVLKSWSHRNIVFAQSLLSTIKHQDSSPDAQLVGLEENKELTRNILKLPMKYREVIFLHYFEDLKVQEMSDLLSLKENSVKTRLRRARMLLKEMY
ncbi:sigma-70 family RNA polymerase sigma factor [Guptibacillus hwajinpoensis]|uniref:RNA polymerase sigma-70 factor (ECF subfamily) n=1 Tax=Guptibacillus hwajinpoensis TaxID=208199 RepID=A0ABU0JY19_9BACL|nr:sigma-70 family RNA polymerase sigma factor [Alkalihalobacillus hemicentroti]MDQ0481151.1 RNA polymerase sigma-70 factor (ECF subfamily) [Alkalihalobacillus hemicentroti]